ncbi:MAG: AMP-binding protein [Minisyncoccales bacterium]
MNKKLIKLVCVANKTPYYRKLWGNIENISDFPFEKLHLSDKKLFDSKNIKKSLAVEENQISHCYFSAGTTGHPKMIPFTEKEWRDRSFYRKRCYELAGINKKSRVAVLLPFGPWIAGPSAQSALMDLGCTVFPMGLMSDENEINGLFSIISRHNIDTIVTAPSFLQMFLGLHNKCGDKICIKKIITSGEFISIALREKIYKSFGAEVYSSYAASESFIGIECYNHDGFHYDPKYLLVETLNQNTYLPDKNTGLIVITALTSEAVPLLRYSTSDLGVIDYSPCVCGSNWPKIIWRGRAQETFVVAGAVNVYSYQIRNALSKSRVSITRCEIEIVDNGAGRDHIIFSLFTSDIISMRLNVIKREIKQLIDNMSMDFNDGICYKIVSTEINLKHENIVDKNIKTKPIKINDHREYTR